MSEQNRQVIKGTVVPIYGDEIDTDRIIPARFLKEITFEKMGDYLFYDARFDDDEKPKDHPLNNTHYLGASIMVVGSNFGCGSSREHAAQAVLRYGIKGLIGESFSEIFAGNCKALGVPTVTASKETIQAIQDYVEKHPQREFVIDLERQKVSYDSSDFPIFLAEEKRQTFLEGTWDEVALLHANLSKVDEVTKSLPYFN